jgi:uncharacterized protein (DUF2252 family)
MAAQSKAKKVLQTLTFATTREERRVAGKILRDIVPRKSHAGWKAPANRNDPLDRLIESSKGRVKHLLPIRYGRMMPTPFTFYRGAAAIMADDLASTPETGIRVQACGDCHLMNFGGFATPERKVVFDINDFDETLPAPWEWDIKRLAASFVVAVRSNKLKEKEVRLYAVRCVKSYREHMSSYADMDVLDRWYDEISVQQLEEILSSRETKKRLQKRIERTGSRTVIDEVFPKMVEMKGGKPQIKDDPPLIYHLPESESIAFNRFVKESLRNYRKSLADDRKVLLDHYGMKDTAMKVVGVGSVGTRCAVLLMIAGNDDPLFLQVKEARESVLEPYAGKSMYSNRGQRVVMGQRLMQAASDIFLGWTEGREGRHFYIRQLRDMKLKPLIEMFDQETMLQYADFSGWALARAHAKSGDPALISGYLGSGDTFDEAIGDFAIAYADQNEQDYAAFLKAIHAGKFEVERQQ